VRTHIRTVRVVFLVVVLIAPAGGCHTMQPSTPLTVNVRDAETQAPVPQATVRVWRFGSHADERDQSFTTGSDGSATAHLAPPDEGGVMVEVVAPGHLSTQITLAREVVDALASAKPLHPYKGPPLGVTVDMYAGPRPTAELVVPVGFRGLVKAEVRVPPNGAWPPGQRLFSYTLPASGVVDVSGPPVFALGPGPDFVAKFADGTALPLNPPKGDDVGFRWLRRDGTTVYYAVGTAADAVAARSAIGHGSDYSEGPAKSGQSGGHGGGGGGGGRSGRGGRGGMGGGGGMGGSGN
jgi:uncharacterized membrane protein YgcG